MTPHEGKHLDGLLATLRRRDDAERPSPEVVRTVLDQYAARTGTSARTARLLPSGPRPTRSVAWRAAAAACGLAAAAAWWLVAAPPDRSVRIHNGAAPIDAAAPVAGQPAEDTTVSRRDTGDVPMPAAPALEQGSDAIDDNGIEVRPASFVALSPIAGDVGVVRLMRVQLPETAIRALGFDLQAPTMPPDGFVEADVLLGEDGVARAIRLIP